MMNSPAHSPIAPELLEILVCPETHQPLRLGDAGLLARLNERQQAGKLVNREGAAVAGPLQGVLVRQDGIVAYGIVDAIPIMLIEEAIPLAQLEAVSSGQ